MPSDTAESNPFLRKDSIPPFNDIDAKQVISGFQKLLVNYETEVNSLVEKLDTGIIKKYCAFLFKWIE